MKKIYIIKAGSTFPEIEKEYGDFAAWCTGALGEVRKEVVVFDSQRETTLPSAEECAGVVITGSHSMVTDRLEWSERIIAWIPALIELEIPLLGVCYGHQLLAQATGGEVGYHPGGKEVGTVEVNLTELSQSDAIFQNKPHSFLAHATHSQTVLRLPADAVRLAYNDFEPNHAFRIGKCAWGIQFHPEFNEVIMCEYIKRQTESLRELGRDVEQLLEQVKETPVAIQISNDFGCLL